MSCLRYVLACLGLILAHPAWAEDVALILGDRGQSSFFAGGGSSDGYEDILEDAGFRVIGTRDRDAQDMQQAARRVEGMLQDGEVERLLILVTGPFAGNGRDNWALGNDAIGASALTVGGVGLSVNALSDLADRAGRGVVMLDPGVAPRSLGAGLRPGLGEVTPVGQVTYLTGDADKMHDVLENDLLDPDQSFAEVKRGLPSGVKMSGFVSSREGFMGKRETTDPQTHEENGYWHAVREIDVIDGYNRYLGTYPNGQYESQARARIAYLTETPEREAKAAEDALNLSRAARREVQESLKLLGFDPRGIDGLFGKGSRTAIAAWQRSNGFPETGHMTGNQLFRLKDLAAAKRAEIAEAEEEERRETERQDRAYWRATGREGTEEGFRAYLARYPDGIYSTIAKARLEEIEAEQRAEAEAQDRAAWDLAQAGGRAEDYRDYLEAYPNGLFAAQAKAKLGIDTTPGPTKAEIAQARTDERRAAGTLVARLLIEQRLHALGYNSGSIDGKFSNRARAAIRRFQKDRRIAATGYVSDATMRALMRGG